MQNEIIFCNRCGCEITEDTAHCFEGDYFCEECFDEATTVCTHCGERVWSEDNAGTMSMPLCDRCYDNHYTSPDGELTSAKFNTAKLDALDYYYSYRPYWWTHAEPEDYAEWFESAAVKELKQFASYIGVAEKDIDLLLEYGYTVDDVEDLLYIPEGVETDMAMSQ